MLTEGKNGFPRGPLPWEAQMKEAWTNPNAISINTSLSYVYMQSMSQICDVGCSTFCMVFSWIAS